MATIQWFPGHMAKAKREVQEQLKMVDVVVELRDARVPNSSKNPMIDAIIQQKPRLVVLNKRDLADDAQTEEWLKLLTKKNTQAIAINSKNQKDQKALRQKLLLMTEEKRQRWLDKGLKHKVIRLMVVGIPNVGKSTFINQFTKRKTANVGNKPGVTKGQQWIKFDKDFELLDTPGILWPKFDHQETATRLAMTGAIKDTHYYVDDVALYAIEFMLDYYASLFLKHFPISESEMHPPYPELLMTLTKNMGMQEDYERASKKILYDFREGKIGKMTIDRSEYAELENSEEKG